MSFKKYPKIRRPSHSSVDGLLAGENDPLVITEKMDGNNFRFRRDPDGDGLLFGSRNTVLGTDPDEIGGMFDDVTDWLDDRVDLESLGAFEAELDQMIEQDVDVVVCFGENAVQHTIDDYNWDKVPQFQLFDAWVSFTDEEEHPGEWLSWYDIEWLAQELELPTVPVVRECTVGAFDVDMFEVPESTFRPDGKPAEGVVIRNVRTMQKAKYISEDFAERHESAKQGELIDPDDDVAKFLHEHVTEQRIEKNIAKLLEEPDNEWDELEMAMMSDLHIRLWRDIWAEDYEEIIDTDWILDMDRAHTKTAGKAADYLEQLLQSGETPVTVVDPSSGETVDPDDLEDQGETEEDP